LFGQINEITTGHGITIVTFWFSLTKDKLIYLRDENQENTRNKIVLWTDVKSLKLFKIKSNSYGNCYLGFVFIE